MQVGKRTADAIGHSELEHRGVRQPRDTALMNTYASPRVTFVRGQGAYLFDDTGKQYIDFFSGIAVTSLGHSHPAVTEAISRQASRLVHVSNIFGNDLREKLAVELDELIGDGRTGDGQVFLCNSGAEANECAIKLARKWGDGKRYRVISAQGSFHGRTLATWAATGKSAGISSFAPLPGGFDFIPYNDIPALEAALGSADVAAFLVEPIQGENGVVVPDDGYLLAARQLCDKYGALLVADEVQTGIAKTGRWFGFQHDEVMPDIVTVAKALGNGMPVGACWARSEVASSFVPGDHGSTFGGQPLACAAALATLKAMRDIDGPARARAIGSTVNMTLKGITGVASIRGRGALIGIVLERDRARQVADAALDDGLVVNAPRDDIIRLAPPLVMDESELMQGLAILAGDISKVVDHGA
ncbi:MAG: acetylornithine transaminase [Acidimicrobiales bacterium]